jgi:uncharacterized protein YukE
LDHVTSELAAALRNLLDQTYQMADMFPDEDQAIARAIKDAEEALENYSSQR